MEIRDRASKHSYSRESIGRDSEFLEFPFNFPGTEASNPAYSRIRSQIDRIPGNPKIVRALSLIAGDAFSMFLSLIVAIFATGMQRQWYQADTIDLPVLPTSPTSMAVIVLPLVFVLVLSYVWGHYTRFKPFWSELEDIVKVGLYMLTAVAFAQFLLKEHISRLLIISTWSSVIVLLPIGRLLTKRILISKGSWFRPTIVIGTGDNALSVKQAIQSDYTLGQHVSAFLKTPNSPERQKISDNDIIDFDSFNKLADAKYKPEVIFAFDSIDDLDLNKALVERCSFLFDHVTVVPPLGGLSMYGAEKFGVFTHDAVFLRLQNKLARPAPKTLKRAFDLIVTTFLVTLLSPVLIALYLVVISDGGKGFYLSKRLGRNGKTFDCYKFRTMHVNSEQILAELLEKDEAIRTEWLNNFKLENDPRITRVGKFMRKTSLDELPQLFNVLRNEMSLVGPRPILVPAEVENYGEGLAYYKQIKPGITGLWQVSGRNSVDYKKRIELNCWYVRNWTLWTDFIILLKTIPTVVRGSGV